ncbi:unnamed protein product [Rangifer tarandus platyrhynchus]|uniref:Uncharacterized protein n=1 Tax=Rangifer tarandus platyrhynchus TaxID=3082113 RepID=A0AC59YDL0_RANTA
MLDGADRNGRIREPFGHILFGFPGLFASGDHVTTDLSAPGTRTPDSFAAVPAPTRPSSSPPPARLPACGHVTWALPERPLPGTVRTFSAGDGSTESVRSVLRRQCYDLTQPSP